MTRLHVVVTDPIISRFADQLTGGGTDGHAWSMAAEWSEARVRAALASADVVVCSRLSDSDAVACAQARLIQVSGAGYDRIALDAVPAHVPVANAYCHGRSIAEHVLMVTMMLSRHVLRADRELRAGTWRTIATDADVPFGSTLSGRVLGIVGLGEIGGHVARVASALGMRVRAVRSNPGAVGPEGAKIDWVGGVDDLIELAAASDVLVVTTPLSERTRGMVGASVLAAMPSTGLLINVARGPVVDERALYEALMRDEIAGAGLDVWWEGSGTGQPSSMPFGELDNVVMTPHQSGHTVDTFDARARTIAANVDAVVNGQPIRNVVREAQAE